MKDNDTNPHTTLGWYADATEHDMDTQAQWWWIYLHTAAGDYRIDGTGFRDEHTARTWARTNLRHLPEHQRPR